MIYALLKQFSDRQYLLGRLTHKLICLGRPDRLKPSLHAKFLRLMDHVAHETEQQRHLYGRIDDLEREHRFRRERRSLRRAGTEGPR